MYDDRIKKIDTLLFLRTSTCDKFSTQVLVWLLACIHTLPLCFLYHTTTIYLDNHTSPLTFCYRNDDDRSSPINMRVYSMVSFVFTYLAPLSIMIVMYLRVSMTLWNSRASVHMRTEVVGSKRLVKVYIDIYFSLLMARNLIIH